MKKKLILFICLALVITGGIVIAQNVIENSKKNRMVLERTEKQTNKMVEIYGLTPAQRDAIYKVNETFQKNLSDLVSEHKGAPDFEVREEAILYSHEQNAKSKVAGCKRIPQSTSEGKSSEVIFLVCLAMKDSRASGCLFYCFRNWNPNLLPVARHPL
jgi:hypothetical protein